MSWHHRTVNCVFILQFVVLCLVCVNTVEQERFEPKEQSKETFEEVEDCLNPIDIMNSNDSVLFSITSRNEMDELCEEVNHTLDCIDKKYMLYMQPEALEDLRYAYTSQAAAMIEICTNETHQLEFLNNVRCINDTIYHCEAKYFDTLEEAENDPHENLAWQRICCALREFQQCSSNETVRVACGEEAAKFSMKTLDAMTSSLLQKCQHFPCFADMHEARNLALNIFGGISCLCVLLVSLILVLPSLLM